MRCRRASVPSEPWMRRRSCREGPPPAFVPHRRKSRSRTPGPPEPRRPRGCGSRPRAQERPRTDAMLSVSQSLRYFVSAAPPEQDVERPYARPIETRRPALKGLPQVTDGCLVNADRAAQGLIFKDRVHLVPERLATPDFERKHEA